MKKYLIRATYTAGEHNGESYLLRRGGYVVESPADCGAEDFYNTEAAAKMVAKRWTRDNEWDHKMYPKYHEPERYEAEECEVTL